MFTDNEIDDGNGEEPNSFELYLERAKMGLIIINLSESDALEGLNSYISCLREIRRLEFSDDWSD